jgi:hypothetical protein
MFNNSFSTKRETNTATTKSYSTVLSDEACYIEPVRNSSQLLGDSSIAKEYHLYCDDSLDVKVADVVTSDNIEYGVTAVSYWQDPVGNDGYLLVVLNKKDSAVGN